MSAYLQETAATVLDSPEPGPKCGLALPEERPWAEAVLAGERRVLEMIAGGNALAPILEALCRVVEEMCPSSFCSILLLDAKGDRLWQGAAPSLPKSYTEAFNGREIASCWGPCGMAAFRREQVIASDIQTDPLWGRCRELVLSHGLQACWSTPIFSSEGKVLGTFAILSREPRSPTRTDQKLIERFTHLASIAIERTHGEEALRRSEAYLAEAQRLSHTGSFGWNVSSGELIWSAETFCILGYDRALTPKLELVLQRVHPEDLALVQRMIEVASRDGTSLDFEHRVLMPDSSLKHVHVLAHAVRNNAGEVEFVGAVMDVSQRKRAEALVAGEKRLLEMIARGDALVPTLEVLCRFGEEMSGNVLVSILLVSPDGKSLRHGAAPSLPKSYTEAIDGGRIGPRSGSCGTAAYRREPVFVSDIGTDPLWDQYSHLALPHGLRACWSAPILSTAREVMGTFALYSREPGLPTPQQRGVIEQMTHLAAVAIERKRAGEALRSSEQVARGQTEALTRTLDALAKESAPDRLVEHVLRTITEQLEAHSSSIWLRNEGTGLVNFEFAFEEGRLLTKSDAALAKISPALKIEDVWMWPEIFRTGKPSVLEDIRAGPPFPWREHVLSLGVISILIVPMLIAGMVEGVIGIRFTRKRSFRTEEMELAQALAHQAMLAIQLGRLSRQSRQAAVAAERNRMARDIHDTLAQGFTGVILQLEAVEEALSQRLAAKAAEHLTRAGELARESLQEARRSVRALRPQTLEEKDLCDALRGMITKMTAGTPVQAEFMVRGKPRELPVEWDENLLRIGQEVLTNVLRHAQASKFSAQLVFDDREIRLNLSDNGSGFDPSGRHDGFGLQGMKERVEGMGGQLAIHSAKGEGTAISIALPLANAFQLAKS
ncbi:MAG TPA: GAF domain-containing protein [Candidatus Binatia bacterium]|jgi:signal transduction histidine kinase|nr:GAF domain-containing protein [Candidatus Binatia bacterium]